MTAIMLSLHPQYVREILAGRKTAEVRSRGIAAARTGAVTAYLYATAPVRGVLGTCRLTEMDLPPGYVWSDPVLKAARITREDLATYGGNDPHLFDVSEPVPYGLCRPLADFGLTRPPQSWCYFPDEAVSHV